MKLQAPQSGPVIQPGDPLPDGSLKGGEPEEQTMADILIIEDDALLRQALARLLERHGYQVREAGNGIEGLKCMQERPARLVITDIIMPEMEGIETIRHLRRFYPHTKIIAMSGGGKVGPHLYLKIASELGAHETLPKPFLPWVLVQSVQKLVPPPAAPAESSPA